MAAKIRATDLVRELNVLFGTPCPAAARKCHEMILNGQIPATRLPNGRFEIARADLLEIGRSLGMVERSAAKVAA